MQEQLPSMSSHPPLVPDLDLASTNEDINMKNFIKQQIQPLTAMYEKLVENYDRLSNHVVPKYSNRQQNSDDSVHKVVESITTSKDLRDALANSYSS